MWDYGNSSLQVTKMCPKVQWLKRDSCDRLQSRFPNPTNKGHPSSRGQDCSMRSIASIEVGLMAVGKSLPVSLRLFGLLEHGSVL